MSSARQIAGLFCALVATRASATPECKRFDEIYPSGKELCENMWDGAFVYETDESNAYTMWFYDSVNPNNEVSKGLGKLNSSHDTCHLDYYHKDAPGPEPDTFTECHPWKNEACCSHGTVETADKLKHGYDAEYRWDRCGDLTPECERFFVQEACFYECDPNAGLFRKYHPSIYDESNPDHNEWQMHGMPIKASYCDAWFTACRKDKFCASDGGSYFSCAAEYKRVDEAAELRAQLKLAEDKAERAEAKAEEAGGMKSSVIIGFVIAGIVVFGLLLFGSCLILKERAGKPMFGKLIESKPTGGGQAIGNGTI